MAPEPAPSERGDAAVSRAPTEPGAAAPAAPGTGAAARARRRAEVFGDDLPTVTSDESDLGEPLPSSRDEQLLADRPPHHERG